MEQDEINKSLLESKNDHEKRITHIEERIGVKMNQTGSPDFITRTEFEKWSQKFLIPRLDHIEKGQNKIMIYITAAGIAGALVIWLVNSGIFKVV